MSLSAPSDAKLNASDLVLLAGRLRTLASKESDLDSTHVPIIRHAAEIIYSLAEREVSRSAAEKIRDLTAELLDTRNLPEPLRSSLIFACRSDRPIRTVRGLALRTLVPKSTLQRQWSACFPTRSLSSFIHLILLVRFAECNGSCYARAKTICVDLRTLRSHAEVLGHRNLTLLVKDRKRVWRAIESFFANTSESPRAHESLR
jgi:hypothetical protein